VSGEATEDGGDLGGGLALTEDDFGHSLAEGTMVIYLGEAEIFKGKMAEAGYGVVGGELFGSDVVEQLAERALVHVEIILDSIADCRSQIAEVKTKSEVKSKMLKPWLRRTRSRLPDV